MTPTLHTDTGLEAGSAVAAAGAAGRFEGSVRRESDGTTFLRAIELGTASGTSQSIRCFEQVGGGLPTEPQNSGTGTALGPFNIFSATDGVAERKYISLVFGNFLISTSTSVYHDGRPDTKLAGLLRKI